MTIERSVLPTPSASGGERCRTRRPGPPLVRTSMQRSESVRWEADWITAQELTDMIPNTTTDTEREPYHARNHTQGTGAGR